MKAILAPLDCQFDGDDVLVPTFRPDLEHKADIAEEIARFYGYNNIPSTASAAAHRVSTLLCRSSWPRLTTPCWHRVLSEIMTYSFISPRYYDKINLPADSELRNSIVISNPLGEDTSIMRTIALPSMMEILAKNYNKPQRFRRSVRAGQRIHPHHPR